MARRRHEASRDKNCPVVAFRQKIDEVDDIFLFLFAHLALSVSLRPGVEKKRQGDMA